MERKIAVVTGASKGIGKARGEVHKRFLVE